MQNKICTICGKSFPNTSEHFHINKDKLRSSCKKCRNENQRRLNKENKEYISKYNKEYRKNNKEYFSSYGKKYRSINRETINSRYRDHKRSYRNRKIKTDLLFKLSCYMRNGMYSCLKGRSKKSKTFDYIQCTPLELKSYLESKFTEGMSWDNYGKWHVDHIRPLSSFDFSVEENLYAAWHYSNLQPLWAEDNLKKGNRLDN